MSKQYDSFMEELEQLMEKHSVAIFPSRYDSIQVWDINTSFQTKNQVLVESLGNFEDRTEGD